MPRRAGLLLLSILLLPSVPAAPLHEGVLWTYDEAPLAWRVRVLDAVHEAEGARAWWNLTLELWHDAPEPRAPPAFRVPLAEPVMDAVTTEAYDALRAGPVDAAPIRPGEPTVVEYVVRADSGYAHADGFLASAQVAPFPFTADASACVGDLDAALSSVLEPLEGGLAVWTWALERHRPCADLAASLGGPPVCLDRDLRVVPRPREPLELVVTHEGSEGAWTTRYHARAVGAPLVLLLWHEEGASRAGHRAVSPGDACAEGAASVSLGVVGPRRCVDASPAHLVVAASPLDVRQARAEPRPPEGAACTPFRIEVDVRRDPNEARGVRVVPRHASGGGEVKELDVSFGDGTRDRRYAFVPLGHAYAEEGTYALRVEAVDDLGRRAVVEREVSVPISRLAPGPAPFAALALAALLLARRCAA